MLAAHVFLVQCIEIQNKIDLIECSWENTV